MKSFSSHTFFKIKSLNQEKKLCEIAKRVTLYKINRIESNISTFEVNYRDWKNVSSLLKGQGVEILEVKHKGPSHHLKKIFTSFGIIAGVILCFVFYCIQYNFIWKIDIFGTQNLSNAQVSDFVRRELPSMNKNSINTQELEIKLKENFERISSVSVAIVGQSLVISINESLLPEEMEGNFSPIYSQFDGKITQINLIQGTLAVDEGDIVQAGDILVMPYIIDADGEQRDVKPEAIIVADVYLQGQSTHYDTYTQMVETGRVIENAQISLFGNVLYANDRAVDFEYYILEESEQDFSKNNILPFKIKRQVYREVIYQTIEKSFEEEKDVKIEEARQKALISLQENEIIKNENCVIKSGGGVTYVTYVITVSREIGG